MPAPPPPPFSAAWRYYGITADQTPWSVGWHLVLPGAIAFDYASVHELHEELLLTSEAALPNLLPAEAVSSVSRLSVTGPASAVGDEVFVTSRGARGPSSAAAVAVPVRQIIQAPGKGRSGRFWLPAPSYEDVDFTWQLTPGAASSYASTLAAFFNDINASSTGSFPSVRFAVIHRRLNGAWLPAAQALPVDTWVLSRRLGTQDRRMSRVEFK